MGQGQGSISVNQKRVPAAPPAPPAPPFALNSAFNGLSVDTVTGQIVLGQDVGAVGDPAQLLSNREIPMNGKSFSMVDAGSGNLFFRVATTQYVLGDDSGAFNGTELFINDTNGFVFLGTFKLNNSQIQITDANKEFSFVSGGNLYLDLNKANNLYQLGDINGSNTGTTLILDDSVQLSRITSASGNRLFLDAANGLYQIGDIDGFNNGWFLSIEDSFKDIIIGDVNGMGNGSQVYLAETQLAWYDNANTYLQLNSLTDRYQVGDIFGINAGLQLDINDNSNVIELGDPLIKTSGLKLNIDNSTNDYQLKSGLFYIGQNFDFANNLFQIGDIGAVATGIAMQIDTGNNQITMGGFPAFNNGFLLNQSATDALYVATLMGNGLQATGAAVLTTTIGNTGGPGNGDQWLVDNAGDLLQGYINSHRFLELNRPGQNYQIGDIETADNGTTLRIDDGVSRVVTTGTSQLIGTSGISYTDGAAAAIGTLLNAPAAGNPSKWIPIDDNGTTRFIPAW